MPPITTHVLDTSSGTPASNMKIVIFKNTGDNANANSNSTVWQEIGSTVTNEDGRGPGLLSEQQQALFSNGCYKMTFQTKEYFDSKGISTFYPYVDITFLITDAAQHYHIPLLISPYGYSTYRGS